MEPNQSVKLEGLLQHHKAKRNHLTQKEHESEVGSHST
jgi:hypothetical protein